MGETKPYILIIEDDDDVREAFADVLSDAGFSICAVDSAVSALAMLAGIVASALLMTLTEDAHVFNLFPSMLVISTGLLARTLDPGIVNEKPRKAGCSRVGHPPLVEVQTWRGRPV